MLKNMAYVIMDCLKLRTVHSFLCKELIKGYLDHIKGEYFTPQGYFIDETKVDVFDQQFPPKKN